MSIFIDQLQRTISLGNEPLRIVSLVPSQTELLYDLGLDEEVVGITKFCIHPDSWFKTKTRVGGTKTVNIERVKSLLPTLIIANKEENTKADLEALEQICPVWISDVRDIPSAFEMILKIGEMLGKSESAQNLIDRINVGFSRIHNSFPNKNVLYVIWNEPLMVAAKDTFIDSIITHLGMENVAGELVRYPELSISIAQELSPEIIFLSSEPYPFKAKHLEEFGRVFSEAQIMLVDGEMFSWYGSRLRKCTGYFGELVGKILS